MLVLAGAFVLSISSVVQATGSPGGLRTPSVATLDRSTVDRPNDAPGKNVHVIYAVPRGGVDHNFDTDGTIQSIVEAGQRLLFDQTHLSLRIDRYNRQVDVTFLQSAASEADVVKGLGVFLIQPELRAAGMDKPDTIYLVFFDGLGPSTYCGSSLRPGNFSLVYLGRCLGGAASRTAVHEVFHNLGIVPDGAKNYLAPGHVSDSSDLMSPTVGTIVDINRDDYYWVLEAQAEPNDGYLTRFGYAKLAVSVNGDGEVVVGSEGSCYSSCNKLLPTGTVSLLAKAGPQASFSGWGGDCSGADSACQLNLTADKAVTANFQALPPKSWPLKIVIQGKGVIKGAGATCSKSCTRMLPEGKRVSLTAIPAKGWRFKAWKGCPSKCSVSLARAKTVTAVFARK